MQGRSRVGAKTILGLVAAACVAAACSLAGGDVDKYNSGNGETKEDPKPNPPTGGDGGADGGSA